MIQWHPLFAHLLRPVLQKYYEILTNVPVGDLPREADIILLRRTSAAEPPFESLWSHLTWWNILEFKGRTESARVSDIDLLVEVGLGINRRFQEAAGSASAVSRTEVSFWYLANHLGRRFLRDAEKLLGGLEPVGTGLWHWRVLNRPIWLVSNRDVPVNRESVPVHLVSDEPAANERAVAEMVVSQPDWWTIYGPWLAALHPNLWKEIEKMARRGEVDIDVKALIDAVGLETLLKGTDSKQVIEAVGPKRFIKEMGLEAFLAELTPAQRKELKRRLQVQDK